MVYKQESRKQFWSIITVLFLVGSVTSFTSIGILYQSALKYEKSRLTALVTSKVKLIDSVAAFDKSHSRVDHPEGAFGATLGRVRQAFTTKNGFGQTGEFLIGQLGDGQVEFLINSRDLENPPESVALDNNLSEAMKRSLKQQSGTMIGLDYASREVLAAYQPIPQLNIGFVAKIDIQEVRAPFIEASVNAAAIALLVIFMGILLISHLERDSKAANDDFIANNRTTPKEWFIYRSLLITTVSIVVMLSSLGILYQSSYQSERLRLHDMVETQASLINAVADFDAKFNVDDFPGGPVQATLEQISSAMQKAPGFGETGEFLLGRYHDQHITFLTAPRYVLGEWQPPSIADKRSFAMKKALSGESGVVLDLDYRNVKVVSAFVPIEKLDAGLVAKIDIEELRQSFVYAGLTASAAAALSVSLGIMFFWRLAKNRDEVDCSLTQNLISQGLAISHVEKVSPILMLFTLALGLAVFCIDLSLPLGIAGGVPYIFFVLTGKLFPKRKHTFLLAIIATGLTYIGYLLSPPGGEEWVVITNRVLAITAIWLTALTVSLYQAQQFAQKIQTSELRKLSLAVEHSPASVIITDPEGIIQYVNQHYTKMTGYSRGESIGQKCNMTRSRETPIKVYRGLWSSLRRGKEWHGEFHNKKRSGELYWERSSIFPITSASGRVLNYVALQEDITERKENELKLNYLATHDNLTGLPTRRLCMDRLDQIVEMAKRKKTKAALLFIDLDGFKMINDTYGHDVGDQVLVETASRLQGCIRQADTVARFGGDEFIILLNGVGDSEGAVTVASKVLESISTPYLINTSSTCIGASIGIALYPDNADDSVSLIQQADQAMYDVKAHGKNSYAFAGKGF